MRRVRRVFRKLPHVRLKKINMFWKHEIFYFFLLLGRWMSDYPPHPPQIHLTCLDHNKKGCGGYLRTYLRKIGYPPQSPGPGEKPDEKMEAAALIMPLHITGIMRGNDR